MYKALMALAIVALGGCGSVIGTLPPTDQRAWEVCWNSGVKQARCGPTTDGIALGICYNNAANEFADVGDMGRDQWLLANGCPESMVQYRYR